MTLPHDVARCVGVSDEGQWREGGEDCLRRTSPGGERQSWMEPPLLVVFECEYRLDPKEWE